MGSSTRAPPPPPLTLGNAVVQANYQYESPTSGEKSRSSSYGSVYSASSPPMSNRRVSSGSSTTPRRKGSSPTVNVHTTCGRHTDQYLFGGFSFTDMAKSVWNRNKAADE